MRINVIAPAMQAGTADHIWTIQAVDIDRGIKWLTLVNALTTTTNNTDLKHMCLAHLRRRAVVARAEAEPTLGVQSEILASSGPHDSMPFLISL